MRLIAGVLVIVPFGALAVLWLGASASLDRQTKHQAVTERLPRYEHQREGLVRIATSGQEFRARVAGIGNGHGHGNVIMLHGLFQTSAMWQPLLQAVSAAGYRAVAFDQRGYSPGARPAPVEAYDLPALAADVSTIAKTLGFDSYHLIGQGWGAHVGWHLLQTGAEDIQTFTTLGQPHPRALEAAWQTDSEPAYQTYLRLPWLPRQVLAFDDFDVLRRTLWSQEHPAHTKEYAAVLAEPGALTAALAWLKNHAPTMAATAADRAPPPVLLVWGNRDPYLAPSVLALHRSLTPHGAELELDAEQLPLATHTPLVTAALLRHLEAGRDRQAN